MIDSNSDTFGIKLRLQMNPKTAEICVTLSIADLAIEVEGVSKDMRAAIKDASSQLLTKLHKAGYDGVTFNDIINCIDEAIENGAMKLVEKTN